VRIPPFKVLEMFGDSWLLESSALRWAIVRVAFYLVGKILARSRDA